MYLRVGTQESVAPLENLDLCSLLPVLGSSVMLYRIKQLLHSTPEVAEPQWWIKHFLGIVYKERCDA